MAVSNFEQIKNYARQAWRSNHVAAMESLGDNYSLGAETGADGGFGNHSLTTHVTDADGVVWTIVSTCDPVAGYSITMTSASKGVDDAVQDPILAVSQEEQ